MFFYRTDLEGDLIFCSNYWTRISPDHLLKAFAYPPKRDEGLMSMKYVTSILRHTARAECIVKHSNILVANRKCFRIFCFIVGCSNVM